MARRRSTEVLQDELWIAYYRAIDLILLNLIWFVATVPIITAIPAWGALFYTANQMIHTGSGHWRTFADGFRRCFWLSWRWGLFNAGVIGLLLVSLWFYGGVDSPLAPVLRLAMAGLLTAWILLQWFTLPLLLEQVDQRFVVALRNSLVLVLRRPWGALGTWLQIAVVVLPSLYVFPPAWVFITASLCAFLANRTVVKSIEALKTPPAPHS